MKRSEDAVCWTLAGLLLAAWAVSLWMGCGPGRDKETAPASPANDIEMSYTNSITATWTSNGVIYYTGTTHTNDLTATRHDPSLTSATRHHLASLGFSYGVQAERGRWTGDTNSLAFTEERLREVVDGMGRDDAAPWGPRARAVGREDTNDVERVAEDAVPGREDAADVERVREDEDAPRFNWNPQAGNHVWSAYFDSASEPNLVFSSGWTENDGQCATNFTVTSIFVPRVTYQDGYYVIEFQE